jgi:transposase
LELTSANKYIERLYIDLEVKLALHNLFVLLLKEEGTSGDLAGDGTGYSVSVENHTELTLVSLGKSLFISSLWLILLGNVCWLASRGCLSGTLSQKQWLC